MFLFDYTELVWSIVRGRFTNTNYLYMGALCLVVFVAAFLKAGRKFVWPRTLYKSVETNTLFWWGNTLFAPAIFIAYKLISSGWDNLGLPQLDAGLWDHIPFWAIVPLALLLTDFADYWNHRAMHQSKLLWPIHAVHHSDSYINPMTTFRVHFLEPLWMRMSYLLLLSWFAIPAEAVGYSALFLSLLNMYVHINWDYDNGPLKYILMSPRLHTWHHADHPDAMGKNLANCFPVFDLMFGTYYNPGPCRVPFGAGEVPENNYIKLTVHPFREWSNMTRAALRRSPDPQPDSQMEPIP